MTNQIMGITLKIYDRQSVDQPAGRIIKTVRGTGSQVGESVPLPIEKEVVIILHAVHKYRDSRKQFEQRIHKRPTDIAAPSQKTVDALPRLEMPADVYIDVKMKTKQSKTDSFSRCASVAQLGLRLPSEQDGDTIEMFIL